MPAKRDLLAQFSRDELVSVVDQFGLDAPNRRKKDDLIDVIAASKRATLTEILPRLSRERLKELCRAFDLDDSGKDKASIVQRLLGTGGASSKVSDAKARTSAVEQKATASEPPPSAPASNRKSVRPNGAAGKKNGGDLGFEATLWLAADKLRNNMDAAEYKHVVLGI
jgi:type I restriction enzyme M protein